MNAQSAGTDDATSVSATQVEEQNKGQSSPSLINALLSDAREMGHIIGDPVRTQPQAAEPTQEESSTEEPETTETETETEPVAGEETEQVVSETSEESEDEKGDEWPESAKRRVADETRKKNERTKERDKALELNQALNEENEKLRAQLENAPTAIVNTNDPLSNVFTNGDFERVKSECNRYIIWATENPHGGEINLGKKGEEDDVRELNGKQAIQLKLAAEAMLREGIPGRRQFLQAAAQCDQIATDIYPDMKDSNSLLSREINTYLRENPFLRSIPDIKIWMGHAIRGRNQFLAEKNGKAKSKTSASKIVESARTKVAPSVPRTRGYIPRTTGADLEKAKKALAEKGDAESAEAYLEAKGLGFGRSKQVERVQ